MWNEWFSILQCLLSLLNPVALCFWRSRTIRFTFCLDFGYDPMATDNHSPHLHCMQQCWATHYRSDIYCFREQSIPVVLAHSINNINVDWWGKSSSVPLNTLLVTTLMHTVTCPPFLFLQVEPMSQLSMISFSHGISLWVRRCWRVNSPSQTTRSTLPQALP